MYICKNRSGTVLDSHEFVAVEVAREMDWTIGRVTLPMNWHWSSEVQLIDDSARTCLFITIQYLRFFCVCWYCTIFWQHLLFPLKGGFSQALNISFAIWSNDFFFKKNQVGIGSRWVGQNIKIFRNTSVYGCPLAFTKYQEEERASLAPREPRYAAWSWELERTFSFSESQSRLSYTHKRLPGTWSRLLGFMVGWLWLFLALNFGFQAAALCKRVFFFVTCTKSV